MPIGTNITALQLRVIKTTTRLPHKQENDFLLELLKFVGVQVIGILLAKFTAGLSLKFSLSAGLSNLTSQLIASSVRVVTDFTINQVYDIYKEQSNTISTLLNLTPAIGEISKISRAYKTTKFFNLAKENKIINHLGITTANNLEQVMYQVYNKKIILDKYKTWFDYTKKPTKETMLNHLGFLARKQFVKNYKSANVTTLGQLLEMETLLRKINPNLVTKTKIFKEKWGNQFLNRYGTNINEISKMPTENWFNLITQMQKSGIRQGTLLSLNTLRAENVFRSQFLKRFNKIMEKTKKLKKLSPTYQIQKGLNKVFEPVRETIKEIELKTTTKIQEYTNFKNIISRVQKKIITDGTLLPLISDVFFAVKVKPTGILTDIAITIYYQNPEYQPIGPIITTPLKLQQLITASSPFKFYMYESGWSIGWGKTKGNILSLMPFLPANVQEFYINSIKLYRVLTPLLKITYDRYKEGNLFKVKENFNQVFNKDNYVNWAVDSVLGKGIVGRNVKNRFVRPLVKNKNINLKINAKNMIQKQITKKITTINKKLNRKW
ncbi:hypothetical protein [Spiroplasma endosymbiont of Clivina fossor]|uniref:hypothetical protein n=1 Tax=Spiroplasma endosymbiont of Clivina fossor TaxID=3066282 RepID=UPI00313D4953